MYEKASKKVSYIRSRFVIRRQKVSLFDKFKKKKIEKKPDKKIGEVSADQPKPLPRAEKESMQKKEELTSKQEFASKKSIAKKGIQIYQFIKEPQITEKSTFLTEQDKYVFKVSPETNKVEAKKAIEALYGVRVKKVNIIHLPSKQRRLGRTQGWRHGLKKGFKKVIATLEKGEKIELLPR
jgi:large subunit ribosomal protein L23